ncbi:MAG: VOC family protein [Verrucomicrobiota bacterium]
MSTPPNPIPEHLGTVTTSLNFHDAKAAIEFYANAFKAEVLYAMEEPDGSGKVMHGEFKIGDTVFMFCDEAPDWGALSPKSVNACPFSLCLYTDDCDATHQQALDAGATEERPPVDYPWGERASMITDPFGFRWNIATHIEDVTPEEINERLKTWQP